MICALDMVPVFILAEKQDCDTQPLTAFHMSGFGIGAHASGYKRKNGREQASRTFLLFTVAFGYIARCMPNVNNYLYNGEMYDEISR